MSNASPARLRAFVERTTRLVVLPDLPAIRLHVADDVTTLWHLVGRELDEEDPPLPYWGFPWSGGLAIAHHLRDHPEEVAGRSVLDLASGSGLCAIAAMRAGAASARAVDIDPLARAALTLNARANGVEIASSRRDLLDEPVLPVDVVLAGDVCYEATMAARMLDWLRLAARGGARVLLGDPGRAYLPADAVLVAEYAVTTTREIEEAVHKPSSVYTFRAGS